MFSIYRQLNRQLFWVGTLAVAISLGIFYFAARHGFTKAFNENLLTRAYSVSSLTDQHDGRIAFDFSEDFLAYLDNETPTTVFRIWDERGKLVFGSRQHGHVELPLPVAGTVDVPEFRDIQFPGKVPARVVSFSFTPRPEAGETQWDPNLVLRVSVAMGRAELDQNLRMFVFVAAGSWAFFTAAIYYFVRRAVKHGLRPLGSLGEQLSKMDETTLAARVTVSEERLELAPIVRHLNELLARLRESFERERRFNSAVAHELRTPLAELRGMCECVIKWPETRETDFDREALEIVLRMEAMMSRMLALSRGELGRLDTRIVPVDLRAAVSDVWTKFAGVADGKKLVCRLDLENGTMPADVVFLDSILRNLMDNAVGHSPDGGNLSIEGRACDGGYVLRFANDAPMLAPEDVAKMFDVFWQKDSSRGDTRHSGLGLSLARVFARAMGWELTAMLAKGKIIFELRTAAACRTPTSCRLL